MMTKWIYLSYPINENTPAYGGGRAFIQNHDKCISKGDTCNTATWTLSNHLGTHLDYPRHFIEHGTTIDDYPIESFFFEKVGIAVINETKASKIIAQDELVTAKIADDIEILLIKTGFCHKREHPDYWNANAGFSPGLADYLRERFIRLRIIGFDSISLSSFSHRELGRDAHKKFLDHRRPILPVEDMDLRQLDERSKIKQLIIAPWRISGADATPCTIMAELYI